MKLAENRQEAAEKRYKEALTTAGGVERLVSGSDDFTLFLWEPAKERKPIGEFADLTLS